MHTELWRSPVGVHTGPWWCTLSWEVGKRAWPRVGKAEVEVEVDADMVEEKQAEEEEEDEEEEEEEEDS